jgi:DNA-binding NarL/FixJ family response regulator
MRHGSQKPALVVSFIEANPLALEFLASLIKNDSSVEIVDINDLALQQHHEETLPVVIVVDACGLPLPLSDYLRRLRSRYPDAKYVIIDHDLPREDLLRLLFFKIDGFLPFDQVPRSLLSAINSVVKGKIWISREILREFVQQRQEFHKRDSSPIERMTSRENQIIELVKRRLSNKEIAEILGIRENTVKFHLSNIYSKIQVGSRHQLIGRCPESLPLGTFPPPLARLGLKS